MSLNGLEIPDIVEAYQGALADAGGWFLLHYVARDEVALLDRGTGGVPEVRNAIANYPENSPLYGFLQYRRRKVVIRYMPEGLSRLVQARSNVQFQSVLDKFTPNDTVLNLSQPAELTESALSSACLLHTACNSLTSSSSSLRRRRLMEITEDAEENGPKDEPQTQPPTPRTRQRSGSQRSDATVVPPPTATPSENTSPDLRPPPSRASSRPPPSRDSPSESQWSVMSPTMSVDSSSGRRKPRSILDEFPRPSEEARMSTQSSRPSLRDLERLSGYPQKVKLGPRPSVDSSGRPRTSGSSRNADQRPVASLPAGMRSSSSVRRPNVDAPRPRSSGNTFASKPNSRAPPLPPLLVPPPSIPVSRPKLSPGAKSLGALSTSSGLTPEKERLMKALQQRKKAMAKRAEQTKKKQSIAEQQEPGADQDPGENKENINHATELVKPEVEEPQHDRRPKEPAMPPPPVPEPVREAQPVHETEKELPPVPSKEVNPDEPPADVAVPDSEGGRSSYVSRPSADTSFSTEQPGPAADTVQAQTLQAVLGGETRAEQEHSATFGQNGVKTSPVPPTLSVEVSPEEASSPVPEPEEVARPYQPETQSVPGELKEQVETVLQETNSVPGEPTAQPEPVLTETAHVPRDEPKEQVEAVPTEKPSIPNVPTDQVETAPTETPSVPDEPNEQMEIVPTAASDTILFPETPSTISPESPTAEPSAAPNVSVSVDPSQQADSTYENAPVKELAPLDQRRKIHLQPIQVPTPEYSDDDNLLSDDSFMEELTSATVQEARPVTVNTPNGGDHFQISRTVSGPNTPGSQPAMQGLETARSVSSNYPDNGPPAAALVAKKINVSSGISNRIKALEKFSSREGTPSSSSNTVTGPSASSSFESLRKRASISLPSGSVDLSPPMGKHASYFPETNSSASGLHNSARRTNSVSVTAHIVRDAFTTPVSSGREPSESDVLKLQASPLTVEHETTEEPSLPSSTAEPSTNHSEKRSMSISSTASSRQAASTSRPGSRLSLSSRAKTDDSVQSNSPVPEEKKGSRASRLMRRMSSITSTSRRSIVGALSSPVKEEDAVAPTMGNHSDAAAASGPPAFDPIDIGEVNVQFPDTLLWKRRFMRIDENGYLVLAPGTTDSTARSLTKRYHLSEFRTPCLPDEDCQELPNSILLNFSDGSTLQCACESRQGQASTLQTLVDAHNAHQP